MSGPVPVLAIPRVARPNTRAASTISSRSTPVMPLATSGVIGSTAARSASRPLTHRVAELVVVQAFGEDRAQQRGEQRDVGAGDELEVEVGVRRDLGAARIDDDEPETPRAAPPRGGAGRRAPGSR